MMHQTTTEGLYMAVRLLALFSTTITLCMYWMTVCPVLYRHGARFPTGFLFHQWNQELRKYRQILRAKSRPLVRYNILVLLAWFTVGVIVLTVALFVGQYLFHDPELLPPLPLS